MIKKTGLLLGVALMLVGCGDVSSEPISLDFPSLSSSIIDETLQPNQDEDGNYLIDIYGLNDLHGAIAESADGEEPGMMKLATFFMNAYEENPGGTVLVASGDMWQGSADSNITKGELMTEIMNFLEFEAMALGNHEFDWKVDAIYENAEISNFPLLGANIIEKATGERADFAEASVLIERGDVQIGIIGTMGVGLESSIQTSYVADYRFADPRTYVAEESNALKSEGADTVILLDHGGWISLNQTQKAIVQNGYVDAVFSGHNHRYDKHLESGVPILQTTGNGKEVMHVQLAISPLTGEVSVSTYDVLDSMTYVSHLKENADVRAIYDYYYERDIKAIKEEVVGKATGNLNQDQLANLGIISMLNGARKIDPEVIGAIHNTGGGIRDVIAKGDVTYGDIYKVFPFDNDIGIFELTGNQIRSMGNRLIAVDEIKRLESSETYKVAVISYVYEYHRYEKGDAIDIIPGYTRDYVAETFRELGKINPDDYSSYNSNIIN